MSDVEQAEIEGLARWIMGDTTEPELAARRHGLRVSTGATWLRRDGALGQVGRQWVIGLRRGLTPIRRRWAVAHELAEWALRDMADDRLEHLADAVAAACLAPRSSVLSVYRRPEDIRDLARAAEVTQTCAALRVGEVADPAAVVAGGTVRTREPRPWVWPTDETLRAAARRCGGG